VIFAIFIPTAGEWPGEFPYSIDWESETAISDFFAPFIRHLSLFPQHFPIAKFIEIINGVFLTIFIFNIGKTVKESYIPCEGKIPKGIETSTYINWALGALISGIIFASSQTLSVFRSYTEKVISLIAIVVFACISYFVLLNLKKKMEKSSDSENQEDTEENF
jgi:hypothetical protein